VLTNCYPLRQLNTAVCENIDRKQSKLLPLAATRTDVNQSVRQTPVWQLIHFTQSYPTTHQNNGHTVEFARVPNGCTKPTYKSSYRSQTLLGDTICFVKLGFQLEQLKPNPTTVLARKACARHFLRPNSCVVPTAALPTCTLHQILSKLRNIARSACNEFQRSHHFVHG